MGLRDRFRGRLPFRRRGGPVTRDGEAEEDFADGPIRSDPPRGLRGLLARLRRRPAPDPPDFDPDLPDPASVAVVDYVVDAAGRLSGGGRRYALGLQWQPRQSDRSLTAQARESTFDGAPVPGLAALFAEDSQVGFGARADGARGGMVAAATAIPMRVTGDSWLGAFRLEDEGSGGGFLWWLVALRDGLVYEDRLIRDPQEALEAFGELLEVPGWKARICPAGWALPDTVDYPLGAVLPRRSRGAVLRPHDPKVIWAPRVAILLIVAVAAGGAWFYQAYQAEQKRLAELDRQRREAAARAAALNVAPWRDTLRLDGFITACAAGMEQLLVIPTGWKLGPMTCTPGDKAVDISAEWTREAGGRASWFIATMQDRGLADVGLAASLQAASVTRSLPVPVESRDSETPLRSDVMEQRLRLRMDTLWLDATLAPGTARSAPRTAAGGGGAANWTNHRFEVETEVIPLEYARLLSDIPGVVGERLTLEPYQQTWRLSALIYHPPAVGFGQ